MKKEVCGTAAPYSDPSAPWVSSTKGGFGYSHGATADTHKQTPINNQQRRLDLVGPIRTEDAPNMYIASWNNRCGPSNTAATAESR
jgi:hypothetical protein